MSDKNTNTEEVLGADLATATAVAVEKPKRVKKVLTEDQIVEVAKAVEIVKNIEGVSENFQKLLAVVPMWTNAEANKATKEEVAVEFGGIAELKAYVANGLDADVAILGGIKDVISTLGAVKSFYGRVSAPREKKGGKKIQVSIAGQLYMVNAEFMGTIATLTKEEKVAKIMAHPSLVKVDTIELL